MGSVKQPTVSSAGEDDRNPDGGLPVVPAKLYRQQVQVMEEDIEPMKGVNDFFKKVKEETKKLWWLAGPSIFTLLCQYGLGTVTQIFAGHIGTIELAAFSVENNVIAGFSYAVMMGMGCALQTLCGQAYGAGEIKLLGIYMQRSWIILNSTALILVFIYIFATPILKLIRQTDEISNAAGTFALYMIPQLFAYATNFPIAKYLQSQSKIMVMAAISAVVLALHTFFSWLFMIKLNWGLVGAAVVLNTSWWLIVIAQFLYILSGACGDAWTGLSMKAFQNLSGFIRLSCESAVMICLEIWYFMVLIIVAGYLKNAKVAVSAFSTCISIMGIIITDAIGLNAAVSVRVSNELGAKNPRRAKLAVVAVGISSSVVGLVVAILLLLTRKQYPSIFSNDPEVKRLISELTPLLSLSLFVNNVQPALTGVAVGAGWQAAVAYVNVGCYYVIGIPLGLLMSYKFNMGIKGLWSGMLSGTILQSFILIWMIYRTNWNKEASMAEARVKKFGGGIYEKNEDVEKMDDEESEMKTRDNK